jgi:serine/threonine-protein kinase
MSSRKNGDNRITDETFARAVLRLRLAKPSQVESARNLLARVAKAGKPIPLADALVRLNVLTAEQRDAVLKRLRLRMASAGHKVAHYRLLRKLGEGGMGSVYLAEDERGLKPVAIKVLSRHVARNPEFMKRFRSEADAMARLNHAHIVRAFSVGQDRGRPFLVMEYCEGVSLDRRLRREERIASPEATRIVYQIASALQYAHARGVIHRDIKPANIVLENDGVAKLLDLGLSKRVDDTDPGLTQSGHFVGTPNYISPEQAKGLKEIDGRTDIYSLGATFYHLVTGEPPFRGTSTFAIVNQHVSGQVPDPQDVRAGLPDGVSHVIRRMMAKRPADRYKDCGELRSDLERLASGRVPKTQALDEKLSSVAGTRRPTKAPAPGRAAAPAAPGFKKRRSLPRIILGVAGLLLVLAILGVVLQHQRIVRMPSPVDAWVEGLLDALERTDLVPPRRE